MLLIRGEVNVLGIASACITLLLEARYNNGTLIGRGKLSIKIKICWCFTLEVEREVEYTLAGGGGGGRGGGNMALNEARPSPVPLLKNKTNGQVRFENAAYRTGASADNAPKYMHADYEVENEPLLQGPLPDFQKFANDYIKILTEEV
jgi:hypothetical protein